MGDVPSWYLLLADSTAEQINAESVKFSHRSVKTSDYPECEKFTKVWILQIFVSGRMQIVPSEYLLMTTLDQIIRNSLSSNITRYYKIVFTYNSLHSTINSLSRIRCLLNDDMIMHVNCPLTRQAWANNALDERINWFIASGMINQHAHDFNSIVPNLFQFLLIHRRR